jgi:hypothetical protein
MTSAGPDTTARPRGIIAVDFDGTIVDHRYPDIGSPVPGALETLRDLVAVGQRLILYTMRSGTELMQAQLWCEDRGVRFWAVGKNPEQGTWTTSLKVYAHVYIDDNALGCPLRKNPRMVGRPFVDWTVVRAWLEERRYL